MSKLTIAEVKKLPKNRGRKRKYFFDKSLKIGEGQKFTGVISDIYKCALNWIEREGLNWEVRCVTDRDKVIVVRTK